MNIKNRILSFGISMALLLSMAGNALAATSSVSVTSGGSAFTSKQYLGATHTQYYCCLDTVKFNGLSHNVIPSGKYVYARIYTEMENQAGDLASFSRCGSGYYYNYKSGYGNINWYKLKTNSSEARNYTASFTWWP